VVDLKPVNLRCYRRSLHIAMLDCDGFGIKGAGERFCAPQFTPENLAPELHGRALGADDEERQDRFALAVVIFQLLNFGIHPFTGRPSSERVPTDIPGRIARRCYAYGLRRNRDMAPSPASGHAAMPLELRTMFDRAFASTGSGRPAATDWAALLRHYARRSNGKLVPCERGPSHEHFAGLACATCARGELRSQAARAAARRPRLEVRRARPVSTATRVLQTLRRRAPTPVPGVLARPARAPGVVIALIVALFVLWPYAMRSCTSACTGAGNYLTPSKPTGPPVLLPTAELSEILPFAEQGPDEVILRQLHRLPGAQPGAGESVCEVALATWERVTDWTRDDPAFADVAGDPWPLDELLADSMIPRENSRGPCGELFSLGSSILRVGELCKPRQRSPGLYPGAGNTLCGLHSITHAASDVLGDSVVYWHYQHPLAWEQLAQAYMLLDDYDAAQAAFVIAVVLYREHGRKDKPRALTLQTPYLNERGAILVGRAHARVKGWHHEAPDDNEKEALVAPWPYEPPRRVQSLPTAAKPDGGPVPGPRTANP
jgi:hypothetical protein